MLGKSEMAEKARLERVRALCDAAALPVTDDELKALTPLYFMFSEGIEKLAELVEEGDAPPIRFVTEA